MKRRAFIFDTGSCFGCMGCLAACANVNGTAPEQMWRSLYKLPPRDGKHDTVYLSLSCNHCENAPCVRVCPTNALESRGADGVVLHGAERCIGCRYCQMACPYGAIRWDTNNKVIGKCNFCYKRLDAGQEPACVATCFAGALTQEIIETENAPAGYKKEVLGFTHHPHAKPSILFIAREIGLNKPANPGRSSCQGEGD
ncbi:MAG: 4Fe-4S dicluster domain-containing protein [Proteobacteria bacterium]|nr:4Fe-4S dicluster domain-containing protein [Pseudomonadota bacterium]